MISDVLSDAIEGCLKYLNDRVFAERYPHELRARIWELVVQMEKMRVELDTPPKEFNPPREG